ncbi:PHP domain-containing protein, partial [Escherichia coli]|uniref:PHP domain-containing protein n=1 Tax=Escherichia coli TaxID=562 RepID=UPI0035D49B73
MSDTNYAVIYDLHSHTTASDCCLTPEAFVHRSSEMSVGTLAITEHDTNATMAAARRASHPAALVIKSLSGGSRCKGMGKKK